MDGSLINQYCDAIQQWSSITSEDEYAIVFYSMIHSGGVWHVTAEGAVEDPENPIHANKPVREVHGRHTLSQLRQFLVHLSTDIHILEDLLICGLIATVDRELESLALGFHEGLQRAQHQALEWQQIYDHPDQHADFIQLMDALSTNRGHGPFRPDDFLRMANTIWKLMPKDPSAEEARRKSLLAAWRRVTAPIIRRENLETWLSRYLDDVVGSRKL